MLKKIINENIKKYYFIHNNSPFYKAADPGLTQPTPRNKNTPTGSVSRWTTSSTHHPDKDPRWGFVHEPTTLPACSRLPARFMQVAAREAGLDPTGLKRLRDAFTNMHPGRLRDLFIQYRVTCCFLYLTWSTRDIHVRRPGQVGTGSKRGLMATAR